MASISREPFRHEVLHGWGCTPRSASLVAHPATVDELRAAGRRADDRGAIARGLGRSYGDAALNAGGLTIDTTGVALLEIDQATGIVTAAAGMSLDDLLRILVPRGLFVPVTPGTRLVTVGGAIAADIHGKNHHTSGSWCSHVLSLDLQLASGEVVTIGPDREPELFWATAGGMGLTGLILRATFRCPSIETSRLVVDTDRAAGLDELLHLMEEGDHRYDYSVAWIDLVATGVAMGRSILGRGRFARADELDVASSPLAYDPKLTVTAPPLVPTGALNRLTVRAFNEVWFRKAPVRRREELQTIPQFFHPLDMVNDWNRCYGPRGFLQWQFVIPLAETDLLRSIVHRISSAGCPSFLAVLKRFGAGNLGPLSFPTEGWTLALDIPAWMADLGPLLDGLDREVADAGGRVYLAKDSRLDAHLLPAMYPRLDEWRAVRELADPDGHWQSDLGRRLGLCG